jgi:hypothetical protein
MARTVRQGKVDGVVGGGVAGVQGGNNIYPRWQGIHAAALRRLRNIGHFGLHKTHATKAKFLCQFAAFGYQIGAALYANDFTSRRVLAKKAVIEQKAQIRFTRTVIDQADIGVLRQLLLQQRLDKLQQMPHLFELAARVLIQPPFAREDVQGLQQLRIKSGKLWRQISTEGFLGFRHEE